VLLAVLAQQLCLPIPSIAFLIAAGALSARGEMRASIIVLLAVLGCLTADLFWFWFGRRWGSQAMRLLCRLSTDPRTCAEKAHKRFRTYGLPILCVAKFFPGLDVVMPPLAGAEGAPLTAFLSHDIPGGFLWSVFYVGLGYVFANQVDAAIGWTKHFATALGLVIGVPLGIYLGLRGLRLVGMLRRLSLRRMSPALLARMLKRKSKVVVIDLLGFEATSGEESSDAIPGSLRVDPAVLRTYPHIAVPKGVDVVLYSASGGATVSARAAMALKRIGVDNVWVLQGGLKAWRESGLPTSESPDAPEVAAGRVGIELPKL